MQHKISIFFVFIIIIISACSQQKKILPKILEFKKIEKTADSSFLLTPFLNFIKNNGISERAGFGILKIKNEDFILMKGAKDTVGFYSLQEQKTYSVYSPKGLFFTINKNNTLSSLVSIGNNQFMTSYKINRIKNFEIIDSFDINKAMSFKREKMIVNNRTVGTNFINFNNNYICGYSMWRPKNNFVDNTIFLSTNHNLNNKKYFGEFPERYKQVRIKSPQPIFDVAPDSTLIVSFVNSNEIAKLTLDGIELKRVALSNDSLFMTYDQSKEKNLSYVDNFMKLDQLNLFLFVTNNGSVVVVKRNRKFKKSDSDKLTAFVLDSQLNSKYKFDLKEGTLIPFITLYKNGILTISDSLQKADYYEIK